MVPTFRSFVKGSSPRFFIGRKSELVDVSAVW